MPPVSPADLPASARDAWQELTDALRRILGDDLVAVWAHGGTIGAAAEPHAADLDTYVILARTPTPTQVKAIEAAHDAIGRERGVEWDAWYVLEADARNAEPPRHAFRENARDTSWAINRAHWLDGRYAVLHGPTPDVVVPPPTPDELQVELSRELEHIERHVAEGDTDPYEATYALLNGSRILHAVETGRVALSKYAAGTWALEHLPDRWHPALHAARRTYTALASAEDVALLATEMAPFVALVRERLPLTEPRPDGELPRWSGF
jgi:Domain of unknown function (DUF4111)